MKALRWANAWTEAATVRAWESRVANDGNDSLEDTAHRAWEDAGRLWPFNLRKTANKWRMLSKGMTRCESDLCKEKIMLVGEVRIRFSCWSTKMLLTKENKGTVTKWNNRGVFRKYLEEWPQILVYRNASMQHDHQTTWPIQAPSLAVRH